MFVKYFCLILCLSVPIFAQEFSRSITTSYNPGFSTNCTKQGLHLVYAKAVSDSNKGDVLHYVVTAGKVGPPTVMLIASKGPDAYLAFNCSNILSENITERRGGIKLMSGSKVFTAGFLVSRFWQYNDTSDKANMTTVNQSSTNFFSYPMEDFVWGINSAKEIKEKDFILLTTKAMKKAQFLNLPDEETLDDDAFASNDSTTTRPMPPTTAAPSPGDLFRKGGQLSLKILLSGPEKRPDQQPRLQFTGNSTQLDVTLNTLSTAFSGARFGLTMVHMSSLQNEDAAMDVNESQSIDDEFTPGIFKMLDWRSYPKSKAPVSELHDRAFLQWKPICYTSSERALSASQQMFYYNSPAKIDTFDFQSIERSAAFPWFSPSSKTWNNFKALPLNISFGQSGDGFYEKTKFTAWSSSMGLGKPPADMVSLLVILIIVIGFGIPVLLIVAGFITVLIRRRRAATESASAVYPVIN